MPVEYDIRDNVVSNPILGAFSSATILGARLVVEHGLHYVRAV
jgi:hypothetical protein